MLQFELSNQLKKSAAMWNRGDLDGFLGDYLHSEDMTFISGGRLLKGFETFQQRYRKSYGDSTASMGNLSFSDLEAWSLGPTQAIVLGRWRLQHDESRQARIDEGIFTLVLIKVDDKWKIFHDHTSSSK